MIEIVVGVLLIIVGIVGAMYFNVFIFSALLGIGLIWNGVGIREREKNKPKEDRHYLNVP